MEPRNYQQRRLRIMSEEVVGTRVLDIGYASLPNPYLAPYVCVGYDRHLPVNGSITYQEHIRGDVRDIASTLAGATFDTILCGELIEHLEEPYRFLHDLFPLLADNGRLILSTPNPLGFPVFLCELFHIKRFFYTRWHAYYFLPRWVERLLNRCGFELCRIRSVGLWLPFFALPSCPAPLSYQLVYVAQKAATER